MQENNSFKFIAIYKSHTYSFKFVHNPNKNSSYVTNAYNERYKVVVLNLKSAMVWRMMKATGFRATPMIQSVHSPHQRGVGHVHRYFDQQIGT